MEAHSSIMYHGKLRASHDKALGDSFWDDAPGVYAFRDDLSYKCLNYSRWCNMFNDGVWWSAIWELCVDRTDRMPHKGTDQWITR